MVSLNNEYGASKGSSFAQKQLEKHGWEKGKGLGKDESGMANAIKVGIKNDTLGVGYDTGKEYTNNWWDQMFNNTANNIIVEHSESGVQVTKKEDSFKKPKKYLRVKGEALLYGRFVKSSQNTEENALKLTPEEVEIKYTDEELLKACGGRTGHKSARHGHQLSGKLKRIADQDKMNSTVAVKHSLVMEESVAVVDVTAGKKAKKKRKEISRNKVTEAVYLNNDGDISCEGRETEGKQKEKKMKRKEKLQSKGTENSDNTICNLNNLNNDGAINCEEGETKEQKRAKKKERREKMRRKQSEEIEETNNSTPLNKSNLVCVEKYTQKKLKKGKLKDCSPQNVERSTKKRKHDTKTTSDNDKVITEHKQREKFKKKSKTKQS